MWVYNGGRGAYLCRNCRTMVCEDVGTYATPDDARTVHRLSAVVGKPCGRVFCSARCAADGGLSANEYAPMFSADRVKMGNRANAVAIGIALGVDAAYRLGGYPAALPLLKEFEEVAK